MEEVDRPKSAFINRPWPYPVSPPLPRTGECANLSCPNPVIGRCPVCQPPMQTFNLILPYEDWALDQRLAKMERQLMRIEQAMERMAKAWEDA